MYSNNIYLKQLYFWVRWLTLVLPLIPHWKVPPSLKFIFSISLFCGWLHLSLLSNTQNSCIRSSIHFTLGSLDTWPCRLIWKKNSLVYTFIQNLNAGVWLPNPVPSQTSSLSQPQWLNTIKKKHHLALMSSQLFYFMLLFPCFSRQGKFPLLHSLIFCLYKSRIWLLFLNTKFEGEDVMTGDWQPCHLGAFLWNKIPLRDEQSSEYARPSSEVHRDRPGVSKLLLPVGQGQSAAPLCKQKFADAVILTCILSVVSLPRWSSCNRKNKP